jgi:type I restriction enzyme, S subunit
MRSNYKRIGDFIRKVDKRNRDLEVTDLRGLSMTKEFRKSTSNIVGTDMSKYKLVEQDQFACDFMSVIRVFKLPVVLHGEPDPVIVSPAYTVFEVADKTALLPEYLMMWMRRPEFDRYANFKCDSAIRGGFAWNELCEVKLPVPSPEKQRDIVAEYRTVADRICLNERLNEKLEEAAQAIYRHWFDDFEFPMTADQARALGKPELEGQPYKSSGGELEYNETLDQDIPVGWEARSLGECFKIKHGFAFKSENFTETETQNILLSPGNFRIGGGFQLKGLRYVDGDPPEDYIFEGSDIAVTMTDLSKKTDTLGFPTLIPTVEGKKLLHNQRLGKVVGLDERLEICPKVVDEGL